MKEYGSKFTALLRLVFQCIGVVVCMEEIHWKDEMYVRVGFAKEW